jgi:hypothetical protein
MRNKTLKTEILNLWALAPEAHYPSGLMQKEQGYNASFPVLTLLAIPWKKWPKGTGMDELRTLLLERSSKGHDIPVWPIAPKSNPQQRDLPVDPNPTGESDKIRPTTVQRTYTNIYETVVMTTEKGNLVPSRKNLNFTMITGSWDELSEYFEGNREGGWVPISTATHTSDQESGYVPPVFLNIDLSLLEGKEPDFKDAGLPTGEDLVKFLGATMAPKNRFCSILITGQEAHTRAYWKLIEAAAPKAAPRRHNIRLLKPLEIVNPNGICRIPDAEEFDPVAVEALSELTTEWKKTIKELPAKQKEAAEAAERTLISSQKVKLLQKIASTMEAGKALKQLEAAISYYEFDTFETLREEIPKKRSEYTEYANEGYHQGEFRYEEIYQALQVPEKAQFLELSFKALKTNNASDKNWSPHQFKGAANALNHWTAFSHVWPDYVKTKLGNSLNASIFQEDHDSLEKAVTEAGRLWTKAATANSKEEPCDPEKKKEIFDWVQEDKAPTSPEGLALVEKLQQLTAKTKEVLEERSQATIEQCELVVAKVKSSIKSEATVSSCGCLYGEITPREPKPATCETLQLDTSSGKHQKLFEQAYKALGETHTPLLAYPHESRVPSPLVFNPTKTPKAYLEPSMLPNLPQSLQVAKIREVFEEAIPTSDTPSPKAQGDKKTEKWGTRNIALNVRLKPQTDPLTELFLDIDQRQIKLFNPVIGKPTGLKECLLWRPVLTRQGITWAQQELQKFGYELNASKDVHNYAERKVRKGEKVLSPNYALTPYEMLAYYQHGERVAEKTVVDPDTGKALWLEGKTYQITPSWNRDQILVDNYSEEEDVVPTPPAPAQTPEATAPTTPAPEAKESEYVAPADLVIVNAHTSSGIQNAERIERLNQVSINFGFATFLTQTEHQGILEIKETTSRDNISVEKERMAEEIQRSDERIEEILSLHFMSPHDHEEGKTLATPAIKREATTLRRKISDLEKKIDAWHPTIEDFMEAFPPEPPALSSQVYEEPLRGLTKKIFRRFAPHLRSDLTPEEAGTGKTRCTIRNYQLRSAALMALKRSAGNSSPPGSGKTLMSIMASWAMEHHYNLIISPTIAMNTWAKELDRVGLHHEMIGYRRSNDDIWRPNGSAYSDLRELTARMHRRERKANRLGKIEPEYFIVSAETLSLGGEGNLRFDPWHQDYPIGEKLKKFMEENPTPAHWQIVEKSFRTSRKADYVDHRVEMKKSGEAVYFGNHLRVWSDRVDNSHEIEKAGYRSVLKSATFRKTIRQCPACEAEGDDWSERGHCRKCGHVHSSTTRTPTGWNKLEASRAHRKSSGSKKILTGLPPRESEWSGSKTSNLQYPAYRLIGKHFGLKIIDEIHNFSSFSSQHGNALLQVKTKDTLVLSGTLCRTHITELEPTLCHIYEPNSGEFPYTPWGMELFKDQFSTFEVRTETEYRNVSGIRRSRRKRTTCRIPEASNLTKLRSLMHGVVMGVSEKEIAKEWGLKPITERVVYIELNPENEETYREWTRKIQEAYAACQTESERTAMLQKGRKMLTHLAYACDGPEKLEATIEWIQASIREGKRCTVVGPSTRFHTLLNQELRNRKIPFVTIGSMAPEKRFEALNKFRDSGCPVLTSRIRLINVNFNQLTCCQKILFTGIDPSPAAIRQMQLRLNRIGQTETVECDFLVTQNRVQSVRGNQSPNINLEGTIRQALEEPEESLTETEAQETRRFPSYEERLFATVLRREKAIQAVLNQADKQRDPQELYDILQDRQTLNQVLQDIATEAKTDMSILKEFDQAPMPELDIREEAPAGVQTVEEIQVTPETREIPEAQAEQIAVAPETPLVVHTNTSGSDTPGKRRGGRPRKAEKLYQATFDY